MLFAVVTGVIQTMQYYTQPIVAGEVASGVVGGSGYDRSTSAIRSASTLTVPQLVYEQGIQRFEHRPGLRRPSCCSR